MVKCPKCSSDQVSAQKKGFSGGKALAGALVAGPVGALAGTHGSGKIKVYCLACGFEWNPKDANKIRRDKELEDKIAQRAKWKHRVINFYDQGKIEKAQIEFLKRESFTKDVPDIHVATKTLRNESFNQGMIVIGVVLFVVVLILFLSN